MAFQVDEVLQEREVLVKPLGKQLSRVRNFVGATVLEGGKVIPVLNVIDIMKSAAGSASSKGRFYDPLVVDACIKLFSDKGFRFQ